MPLCRLPPPVLLLLLLSTLCSSSSALTLEHSWGLDAPFSPRETLRLEAPAPGGSRWRVVSSPAPGSSGWSPAAVRGEDYYRLRVGGVSASVKLCVLSAASFRHDVALTLDSAGVVRGVELRPHVPAGFAGCSGGGEPLLPPAAGMSAVRLLATPPEAAAAIPVVPGGKGLPFAGQRELDDAEVAAVSAAVSGAPVDPEMLAAMRRSEARDKPQEQSFLQKYGWVEGGGMGGVGWGGWGGGGMPAAGASAPARGRVCAVSEPSGALHALLPPLSPYSFYLMIAYLLFTMAGKKDGPAPAAAGGAAAAPAAAPAAR